MTNDWRTHLRCVVCRSELRSDDEALRCTGCATTYALAGGRPVLIRKDHPLFSPSAYSASSTVRTPSAGRQSSWREFVPSISVNLAADRMLERMRQELRGRSSAIVLVVGSGRQRAWLTEKLAPNAELDVIYVDIDTAADVDLFCDAHELPFEDQCIDAVVTTAVLEHVMYPEEAVHEISRVLKPDGLVYSEMPFIQQVHEGAYDFTRYTHAGHRRLLNSFSEIESGMVAGPGTALAWAIEYFLLSFASGANARNFLKAASRFAFSWLKYFDYWLQHRPAAMDAASCTYFLGRKAADKTPDSSIVRCYRGGQPHFSHV